MRGNVRSIRRLEHDSRAIASIVTGRQTPDASHQETIADVRDNVVTLRRTAGTRLADRRRAAPRPIDAGVTIGHVHLRTADINPIRAFYVEVLGFDVVIEARVVPG